MDFRRVQWMAIALPAVAIGVFEFFRHPWLEPMLPVGLGNILGPVVVAGTVYGFVQVFIGMIQRSAQEVTRARSEAAVIVERQRIAREMHDSVAQALFYSTVKVNEADTLLAAGEYEKARGELLAVQRHLKESEQRVRAVIADLKQQADLEDLGQAVRRVAAQVEEGLGMQVTVDDGIYPDLSTAHRQHLLAMIHEALTNAHRHGRARTARVSVQRSPNGVSTVEVFDNGVGFHPQGDGKSGSYGLTIMAERARMIGGDCHVESASGRGTRVIITVPEADK